jgi:hypothetical protein
VPCRVRGDPGDHRGARDHQFLNRPQPQAGHELTGTAARQ